MIEKMHHMTLWATESQALKLFNFLLDSACMHLQVPEEERILEESSKLMVLHQKIQAMLDRIGYTGQYEPPEDELFQTIEPSQHIDWDSITTGLDQLNRHLNELKEGSEAAKRELEITEEYLEFPGMPQLKANPRAVRSLWWVTSRHYASALLRLQYRLGSLKLTGEPPVSWHKHDVARHDMILVELSVPKVFHAACLELMAHFSATQWVPQSDYRSDSYETSMELIAQRRDSAQKSIDSSGEEHKKLLTSWAPRLLALQNSLNRHMLLTKAMEQCTSQGRCRIIHGWIPDSRLKDFTESLKQTFDSSVAFCHRAPLDKEMSKVPTLLHQKKPMKPFQLFLKMVQPPGYGSFDPTALIGIFFPFFAGCIVGDMGYSLVMLVLLWLLSRRYKGEIFKDVRSILTAVSIWSIFWGAAYGEFFGDLAHRTLHLEPLWVERSHAVMPVLAFTVTLGLGHILLGLLIGLVHQLRNRHHKHAMEKGGNILVILAMVICLMSLRQLLPQGSLHLGIGVALIGLVLLAIGGGIGGVIESFSSFGNILSYVRIGAIGLSSAILAVTASKFIDVLGISVLGVFAALAIHLLNFVLAFAESGLHAARLHYVEFMGKFYQGNGVTYTPFSDRRSC